MTRNELYNSIRIRVIEVMTVRLLCPPGNGNDLEFVAQFRKPLTQ